MAEIREHQLRFRTDPESLPAEERDYHGGPSVQLLDHPEVVGVLNEILSNQSLANEECYGFRYDHTGLKYRVAGEEQKDAAWGPHGGGGIFNFRGNSHIYQMEKGHIHAGLVRVVWELNDVAIDSGGERPPGCGFSTAANLQSVAADRRAVGRCRDALYPREP